MVEVNILLMLLIIFALILALSIKLHVLIRLSRMAVVNSEVSPTAHVSSLAPTPSLPHTLPTSPPLVSESLPSSSHSPSSSSLLTPPLVESLPSPTVPSVLVAVPAQNIYPMITISKDGIFKPKALAVTLWCDNVSALAIASNLVFHALTKHVEVDYHFVRERVLRRDLQVRYIATGGQLADIFTKSLSSFRFQFLCSKTMVSIDPLVLREDVSRISDSAKSTNEEGQEHTVPMVT
uniref:Uncharacterized protein n=1 Tax=Quercus lobata TaxID=97700 RepID=A0A7N2MUE5_QUELO